MTSAAITSTIGTSPEPSPPNPIPTHSPPRYRADQPTPVDGALRSSDALPDAVKGSLPSPPPLNGRALLETAAKSAAQCEPPCELIVVTGDSDTVVPVRASRTTAALLGVEDSVVEMEETGHLPMDERPEKMAQVLIDFIRGG